MSRQYISTISSGPDPPRHTDRARAHHHLRRHLRRARPRHLRRQVRPAAGPHNIRGPAEVPGGRPGADLAWQPLSEQGGAGGGQLPLTPRGSLHHQREEVEEWAALRQRPGEKVTGCVMPAVFTTQCMLVSRDGEYVITGGDKGIVEVSTELPHTMTLYMLTFRSGELSTWLSSTLFLLVTRALEAWLCPTTKSKKSKWTFCLSILFLIFRFLMAGLATGSVVVFHIDFNKWHHEFQQRY